MKSEPAPDKPPPLSPFNEVVLDESKLIKEMRQELLDSHSRINSLRIELQRAENEVYKVERLWHVLMREKPSQKKIAKVAYLAISSVIPDGIKFLIRPLTNSLRKTFRHFEATNRVTAYRVRLAPGAPPKKRVLHAIANFMTGGSSRLVVDLVEGLGHIYHQEVLTRFIPTPVAYEGVAVRDCKSPYEMVSILRRFQPDVLHVHYWGDIDFEWYDKVFRAADEVGCKIIENVNTPVIPYRSRLVQRYVYVSDYVMRDFGRSGENSIVIFPGSEVEAFSRKKAAITPEHCIGMVYRLEPDKLRLQSIDVFITVAKIRPDIKVLIVGDGTFLDSYKASALAHGVSNSFSFTGAVPYSELPDIYAQMSVFVAPVWKESFGQVSSFAMSMGIPVVGYKVGGLVEIVDDDELLAPAGDSDRLARIIIKLLNDREMRHQIGQRNQLRVKALFSVDQMIKKYEDLYRNVIDGDK